MKTHSTRQIKIQRMVFQALLLKRATWQNLDGPSPIQQPPLNRNDSHPRVSSKPLIEDEIPDRTVTPKFNINGDVLQHCNAFLDDFE